MRTPSRFILAFFLTGMAFGQWELQRTETKAEFRGLSVANDKVAWAGGNRNTYARTTDGGETWAVGTLVDKEVLDFRDVEAINADTAYLLSIGTGTKSRIYKTTDGGKNWAAQVLNPHPKAFLDAFAFWDAHNGIAVGDPIDGRFLILRTTDGGAHWIQVPGDKIPPALPNDGVFAASGTTITVYGRSDVWFATGGSSTARVFRSNDKGQTWSVSNTPVISGQASTGIFSIAFRDALNGIVVGGDYRKVDEARDNIAGTADGGRTWTLFRDSGLGGFRSCVAYVPRSSGKRLLAVGPSGSDCSTDGGMHWAKYDSQGFHVFAFARARPVGWAAGAGGRIARYQSMSTLARSR